MDRIIGPNYTLPQGPLILDNWIGTMDLCRVAGEAFGVDYMTIYLATKEYGAPQFKIAMRIGGPTPSKRTTR